MSQFPDALASGVKDRVGDRCADTGDADLADPVSAHRRLRIGDVGPHYLDLRDVQVARHMVIRDLLVSTFSHVSPFTLLEECTWRVLTAPLRCQDAMLEKD